MSSQEVPLDVTVVILTKDEMLHIGRVLRNLHGLVKKIIVVDSFSTDDTVLVAKSQGAMVLQNRFINHAKQFQWALDNANIETQWIMRLDADELIEPDLRAELFEKLPALPETVVGVNLKRKHIFMNRWIRHGGRYPLVMLRIWRNGSGRAEDRWMDEHMIVWGGSTITLDGGFVDHNLNDLTFFTDKHNGYATREAIDVLISRHKLAARDKSLNIKSTSFQASTKRFMKQSLYNRLPFTWSALLYFLWRYVGQLGFLDGKPGLIYHFLQGFWYRFLVGAKLIELESAIVGLGDPNDIIEKIRQLTGHDLDAPDIVSSPL